MSTIDDYLRVCEEAVRIGGRVVQNWVGRAEVREKGPADLVTQADLASQEAVRRTVLGAFPDHCLLGEEKGPGDAATDRGCEKMGTGTSPDANFPGFARAGSEPVPIFSQPHRVEYRWIVDPLDGTTNFVHGVPHYCVSLALERNGDLLVGAVYNPLLDECFTAAAGGGAWLGGRPIHASRVSALSEALVAVGFPPNVQRDSPDLLLFLELVGRCQGIRRTGSSALNLCYLAAGRFDAYWSYSTHVWDVAAGVLILREAGGRVTSPTGGEFCLDEAHFLAAANPGLHAQLREIAAMVIKPQPVVMKPRPVAIKP